MDEAKERPQRKIFFPLSTGPTKWSTAHGDNDFICLCIRKLIAKRRHDSMKEHKKNTE